ncbi:hypothetical protein PV10_07238 [Exophiala mesophila]|uniref:protein-histidine N-methyltransferase n=1 Tax=Exophiala mesophila TaxID=212818 RepID=A0A0D1WLK1_EXOME|nr:uncharacterized protein PV10_07238 [Exophiala mesophila]KIV89870.1 hypothetical protein PV10_07238 [Exophiala mesophila]
MSFSFGFSGDDIEDDGEDGLVDDMSKHQISEHATSNVIATLQPKKHALQEMLLSIPSQLSYNTLRIPIPLPPSSATSASTSTSTPYISSHHDKTSHSSPSILRRSLFDIRAQLMAEADMDLTNTEPTSPSNSTWTTNLLSGLENGDLTSGIYEGGFKTWECALDLAGLCSRLDISIEGGLNIIELGAGSAIPSLVVLQSMLAMARTIDSNKKDAAAALSLTLCDYNEDVLRLATAPNLLLNYAQQCQLVDSLSPPTSSSSSSSSTIAQGQDPLDEGDLDMDDLGEDYISRVETGLRDRNISIDFISGGWGPEFVDLILPPPSTSTSTSTSTSATPPSPCRNLLILASETIYSPSATAIFADTVIRLLRRHRELYPTGSARAWIAAKKVYFGVGGGVDDFKDQVQSLGGCVAGLTETSDTGVGRVIIEVTVVED